MDKIFDENIYTVLLYNSREEQSFPVVQMNSSEKLILKFDDLYGDYASYTYTIEHCSAKWELSSISPMEYVTGFNRNFIINYKYSSNTLQPYVHYNLELPNADFQFKLSGNYILKVFRSDDENKPVFMKRLMVVDTKVQVEAEVVRSTVINDRNKKQKVDFFVYNQDVRIDNPFDQLKVVMMQNNNWKTALINEKPSFFEPGKVTFNHVDANVFDGLNEFRRFDARSTRFLGERLARIDANDVWDVYVQTDQAKGLNRYVEEFDLNGNYYVKRTDMNNSDINADYIHVHFSYDYGSQNPYGDYYVLGRFNDWEANAKSKMTYNLKTGNYEASIYLKQGIYDYMIGFKTAKSNKVDFTQIEGNFFETENDYRIMVYYRRTGNRYDELLGVREIEVNP